MSDLFGEVNPTKQALYELEQKRLNRKNVAMIEGKGELFAGPRPVQLSIEDAAPVPVPPVDEDSQTKETNPIFASSTLIIIIAHQPDSTL